MSGSQGNQKGDSTGMNQPLGVPGAGLESAPGPEAPAILLPRVTIRYCTQCRWMLRAAYFAQELLSTFSTALGEVALQPDTGGVFRVVVVAAATATADSKPGSETRSTEPLADNESASTPSAPAPASAQRTVLLWDRKTEGGFPEVKELKRRVRDVIQPGRDLGHVDRTKPSAGAGESQEQRQRQPEDQHAGQTLEPKTDSASESSPAATATATGASSHKISPNGSDARETAKESDNGRAQGDTGDAGGSGGSGGQEKEKEKDLCEDCQ